MLVPSSVTQPGGRAGDSWRHRLTNPFPHRVLLRNPRGRHRRSVPQGSGRAKCDWQPLSTAPGLWQRLCKPVANRSPSRPHPPTSHSSEQLNGSFTSLATTSPALQPLYLPWPALGRHSCQQHHGVPPSNLPALPGLFALRADLRAVRPDKVRVTGRGFSAGSQSLAALWRWQAHPALDQAGASCLGQRAARASGQWSNPPPPVARRHIRHRRPPPLQAPAAGALHPLVARLHRLAHPLLPAEAARAGAPVPRAGPERLQVRQRGRCHNLLWICRLASPATPECVASRALQQVRSGLIAA